MGYTSNGLPNGGRTAHYAIGYDEALSQADGLERARALFTLCEQDFALMQSWFGGINLKFSSPLPVHVANSSSGGSWTDPPDIVLDFATDSPTIVLGAGSGASVNVLRYLLVSEVTEMFMATQDKGWYESTSFFEGADEGSKGEGLSRFLGVQFQLANGLGSVPPPFYGVGTLWLNSVRQNYVDNNPDDHNPDPTNGCTTLFLYYLHSQLGYTINQIVAAASANLAGVYKNLTGKTDAWASFIALVNSHYPPNFSYNPTGDNIFPVSNLASFGSPNQITCGYGDSSQIVLDNPAMAEVHITLTSADTSIVSVPPTVMVPVGASSVIVPISTTAIAGPFAAKSIEVTAAYAGKTVSMTVEVVPPRVASVTLDPSSVTCGDGSTGSVTLARPSLLGAVVVDVISGAPGFAAVQTPVTIPERAASGQFSITTPSIEIPFSTAHATIQASYADSSASAQLTVRSRVVAGILQSLTLLPSTVTQGNVSHGTVTLQVAVPIDTLVGLAAIDGGGHLPQPGNSSSIVTVPAQVTIQAHQTSKTFPITTRHELSPGTRRLVTIMAGAVVTKYAGLTVTS